MLTSAPLAQVYGNWNAPEAVTAAAVIYCVRCLVSSFSLLSAISTLVRFAVVFKQFQALFLI